MRRITIKCARTWHYRKMRPRIEPSNDLALSSPFRSWLDCITNTSGYDFRKGQSRVLRSARVRKKGWTLAQLLRGGEQQATRVQPKALGPLSQPLHLPG